MYASINCAGARGSFPIADGGHSLRARVKMAVRRKNCSIFGLKGDTEHHVLPCDGEPTGVYKLGTRKNVHIDKLHDPAPHKSVRIRLSQTALQCKPDRYCTTTLVVTHENSTNRRVEEHT